MMSLFSKHPRRRAFWASLILTALLPALSCSSPAATEGTNTNWLEVCASNADCSGGICQCGSCTRSCAVASDCSNLVGTSCTSAADLGPQCAGAAASVCVAKCSSRSDCTAVGVAATCESGLCRNPRPGAGDSGGAESHVDAGLDAGARVCAELKRLSDPRGHADAATVAEILGPASAATCEISADDYDRTCTANSDCVAIGEGNACTFPCEVMCPDATINVRDYPRYQADIAKTPLGPNFSIATACGACDHCAEGGFPRCRAGKCVDVFDLRSPLDDGGPSSVRAPPDASRDH